MMDQLLTPEDFIREGESLVRIGQRLIAYGEGLKGRPAPNPNDPNYNRQLKKEQREKEKQEQSRMILERIFQSQDKYLAKQKAKEMRGE